jgi:hypothetical protein
MILIETNLPDIIILGLKYQVSIHLPIEIKQHANY